MVRSSSVKSPTMKGKTEMRLAIATCWFGVLFSVGCHNARDCRDTASCPEVPDSGGAPEPGLGTGTDEGSSGQSSPASELGAVGGLGTLPVSSSATPGGAGGGAPGAPSVPPAVPPMTVPSMLPPQDSLGVATQPSPEEMMPGADAQDEGQGGSDGFARAGVEEQDAGAGSLPAGGSGGGGGGSGFGGAAGVGGSISGGTDAGLGRGGAGGTPDCPPEDTCTEEGGGALACDFVSGDGCSADERCSVEITGEDVAALACMEEGVVSEGEICTVATAVDGPWDDCSAGTICEAVGSTTPRCRPKCTPDDLSLCTPGSRCFGLFGGLGACRAPCDVLSRECGASQTCVPTDWGTRDGYCGPALGFVEGQDCSDAIDCADGLFCYNQVCTRLCMTEPDCDTASSCVLVQSGGLGLCQPKCDVLDQDCERVGYSCHSRGLEREGVCLPVTSAPLDLGYPCEYATQCPAGSSCIQPDGAAAATCVQYCTPAEGLDDCPSGDSCTAFAGYEYGVCW